MVKLKSCPFCGGEATLVETPYIPFPDSRTQYPYQIYCTDCFCGTDDMADEEECIRRWNRRAER